MESPDEKLLGDHVEDLAKKLQIDKVVARIEQLTKQKCNCGNRKAKLNAMHVKFKQMTGQEYN